MQRGAIGFAIQLSSAIEGKGVKEVEMDIIL